MAWARLRPHLAAAGLVGFYVVHFSWLSVAAHWAFETGAFDLGIFDQGTWLLSRFEPPFVTLNGRNLFGDHMSLVLLGLVPVYWVLPRAEVLLVAQALAIGLAGIPIYLLALERMKSSWMATVMLAAFLLHPALQWGTLDEFHPEAFLVLFAATALYSAVMWKPGLLGAASVACLLTKEDSFLFVFPLAVWVAFCRDRRVGFRIAFGSVVYALITTAMVMPALGAGPAIYADRIPFGGPWGMIETLVNRPADMLEYLGSEERPFYLWQMAFPTALLFLRTPGFAAIALPVVTLNLVSAFHYQHEIAYHYSLVLVPLLVAGAIYGIGAFRDRQWREWAAKAVAVCSMWGAVAWGVFPDGDVFYRQPSMPEVRETKAVIERIPPEATVSADYSLAPHLSHRKSIYVWPNPFRASNWGRFDREGERLPGAADVEYLIVHKAMDNQEEQEILREFQRRFRLLYETGEWELYRRSGSPR